MKTMHHIQNQTKIPKQNIIINIIIIMIILTASKTISKSSTRIFQMKERKKAKA